jgi:hypothetical protein
MKTLYDWKSEYTHILRKLNMSKRAKEKAGWTRNIGAGFIKADINDVELNDDGTITIIFFYRAQTFKVHELNLRETDEVIRFVGFRKLEQQIRSEVKK